MKHFVGAVKSAIAQENWYAALTLALTLPDICGRLEAPTAKSKERYVQWCTIHLTPRYTSRIGADSQEHVFLYGEDCYALRCAVLHEGADDIVSQHTRRALNSFQFIRPPQTGLIHCNQIGSRLQLQVDRFCFDICAGVEDWIHAAPARAPHVREGMDLLMKIDELPRGF
jgi:hypothetical protein